MRTQIQININGNAGIRVRVSHWSHLSPAGVTLIDWLIDWNSYLNEICGINQNFNFNLNYNEVFEMNRLNYYMDRVHSQCKLALDKIQYRHYLD